MSAGAGVKYAAPSSAYSKIASASHMREAPQNIQHRTPIFIWLFGAFLYQIAVVITAAKIETSSVIVFPLYAFADVSSFALFSKTEATANMQTQTTVMITAIVTPTVAISCSISALSAGFDAAVRNGK